MKYMVFLLIINNVSAMEFDWTDVTFDELPVEQRRFSFSIFPYNNNEESPSQDNLDMPQPPIDPTSDPLIQKMFQMMLYPCPLDMRPFNERTKADEPLEAHYRIMCSDCGKKNIVARQPTSIIKRHKCKQKTSGKGFIRENPTIFYAVYAPCKWADPETNEPYTCQQHVVHNVVDLGEFLRIPERIRGYLDTHFWQFKQRKDKEQLPSQAPKNIDLTKFKAIDVTPFIYFKLLEDTTGQFFQHKKPSRKHKSQHQPKPSHNTFTDHTIGTILKESKEPSSKKQKSIEQPDNIPIIAALLVSTDEIVSKYEKGKSIFLEESP